MPNLISRQEAKEKGLKQYFTGKPCKNGHVDKRSFPSSTCLQCARIATKKCYAADPEKQARCDKKYYQANKEKVTEYNKKYYQNNKDAFVQSNKKWREDNPDIHNAHANKRRAAKLQRTPPWLSKTQFAEIAKFYTIASQHEESMTVDHIVPLQGKLVSGLHVPWNLQIISPSDNSSKGNRHII